MKTFTKLMQEKDMMGWFSIPKVVKDDLQRLGYNPKSANNGVKFTVEDDWGDLYVKVENKKALPSKEIMEYVNRNENVNIDENYPVGGFTIIIRI